MGIFSNTTPFDEQLDKATNELNTDTDWGVILSLCDKIKMTTNGPSIFQPAILTKLNHKIPHVSMQAITVLDACVNNCGKEFHKLLASTPFTDGLREFLHRYKNPTVTRRLRYFIRKWAEELKDDSHFARFVSFYYDLRSDGMDFPDTEDNSPPKRNVETSTNPDAVASVQEADDIAKAIEASLKEEKQRKTTTLTSVAAPVSNLYPSVHGGGSSSYSATPSPGSSGRKVKALYDFEAAEDNELTFKTGDLISILDDSDANWWKGEGSNGSGLFPSNFVTSDLSSSVDEEPLPLKKESVVKFNEELEVKEVVQSEPVLQINEELIDQTLAALQSTDPETTVEDPEELIRDESSCLQMGRLIDNQLEDLDRKHFELAVLNEKILDALKMYDNLMKKAPVYPTQPYSTMTHPAQSSMMTGYVPQQPYSMPYMAQQHGQQPGMSHQMVAPPIDQSQGYNPMYHGVPPSTTYAAPLPGQSVATPADQQHSQAQQNAPFPSMRQPSNPSAAYGSSQSSVNHADNTASQMMTQYQQPGVLATGVPANNYSTNQMSSQPLM